MFSHSGMTGENAWSSHCDASSAEFTSGSSGSSGSSCGSSWYCRRLWSAWSYTKWQRNQREWSGNSRQWKMLGPCVQGNDCDWPILKQRMGQRCVCGVAWPNPGSAAPVLDLNSAPVLAIITALATNPDLTQLEKVLTELVQQFAPHVKLSRWERTVKRFDTEHASLMKSRKLKGRCARSCRTARRPGSARWLTGAVLSMGTIAW